MWLISKRLRNSVNLSNIWHSLLFRKLLSLWLVHDLILTGCTSHFGEQVRVESVLETSNLSLTTKRNSFHCLVITRSLHWQGGSGYYSKTPAADVSQEKGMRRDRETRESLIVSLPPSDNLLSEGVFWEEEKKTWEYDWKSRYVGICPNEEMRVR